MKGEGPLAAQTILEYLIVHLRNEKEEQLEEFSIHKGTLVVSLDIEDSVQHVDQSYCATVISAKGDFCRKLLSDWIQTEIKSLLPELSLCKSQSGRGCPHDLLHAAPFQLSFEFYEKSGVLKEDCLAMKQFIHRISLVHTMIKFHYCVKVNGLVSAETYSPERRDSTCLPDGTRLLIDGSHFARPVSTETKRPCNKIHPTSGEPVGLLIPSEVAERGFSGDVKLIPVVSLCPCWKQFPNQPVRIAALDTARPDARYELHPSHEQSPACEEQKMLLFLFLSYSDPFQDKPAYNFLDRRVILSHLDPILMFSEKAVKGTIQGVLNRVLEQYHRVAQEQQKLMSSLSIMVEAMSTIIASSTDSEFRRRCLQRLQVADTQQFLAAAKKTFSKVSLQRWKPSSTCDIRRAVWADLRIPKSADWAHTERKEIILQSWGIPKPLPNAGGMERLSTDYDLPPVRQDSSSCVSSAGLEKGGNCGGEGLLLDRSAFEGMRQIKKRRPTSKELSWEDLRDPNTSGKAAANGKGTGELTELGTTLSSSFSHPMNTGPHVSLSKSQGETLSANRDENPCQNDDVWNQEVSKFSEWTS